nr:hypothetical protein [Corynebacterium accolens]
MGDLLDQGAAGAIEKHINADNHRAIAGMSMSATSSLLLAQHTRASTTPLVPLQVARLPRTPSSARA